MKELLCRSVWLMLLSMQVLTLQSQNFLFPSFPEYNALIGFRMQHPFFNDSVGSRAFSGAYDLYGSFSLNHMIAFRAAVPFAVNRPDAENTVTMGNVMLGFQMKSWRYSDRGSVLYLEIGLPTASGPETDYIYGQPVYPQYALPSLGGRANIQEVYKYLTNTILTASMDYAYYYKYKSGYCNVHINPVFVTREYWSRFMINAAAAAGFIVYRQLCLAGELGFSKQFNNEEEIGKDNPFNLFIAVGLQLMEVRYRPALFFRMNSGDSYPDGALYLLGIRMEVAFARKELFLRRKSSGQ